MFGNFNMNKYTFTLSNIKSPDLPDEILRGLGYELKPPGEDNDEYRDMMDKHFRHAEYFDLTITVDEDLNIVGGEIKSQ